MFCDCSVLWLFLKSPWFDLLCVIVVIPDHTDVLFHDNTGTVFSLKYENGICFNIFAARTAFSAEVTIVFYQYLVGMCSWC